MKLRSKLALSLTPALSVAVLVGCLSPNGAKIIPDLNGVVSGAGATANEVPISAAEGGVVRTADGSATLTIPPGALTGDTQITLKAQDVAEFNKNLLNPEVNTRGLTAPQGLVLTLNMSNDVVVGEGQELKVTGKTDPAFVAKIKAKVEALGEAFDPAKYGFSQDASGTWFMTMAIKGAVPEGAPDPIKNFTDPNSTKPEDMLDERPFYAVPPAQELASLEQAIQLSAAESAKRYHLAAYYVDYFSPFDNKQHRHGYDIIDWGDPDIQDFNRRESSPGGISCGQSTCGGRTTIEECATDRIFAHGANYNGFLEACTGDCKSVPPPPPPNTLTVKVKWDGNAGLSGFVSGATVGLKTTSGGGYSPYAAGADGIYAKNFPTTSTVWSNATKGPITEAAGAVTMNVDRTVTITLTANKPNVTFHAQPQGGTQAGGNARLSVHRAESGNINQSGPIPNFSVALPITTAGDMKEAVSVNSTSYLAATGIYHDIATSGSTNVQVNGSGTVNYKVWYSGDSTGSFNYSSNDNGALTDLLTGAKLPANVWSAKAGTGRIEFVHTQSSAAVSNWPAAKVFTGASSATAWGLNGTAGTGKVSVTGDVTLAGSTGYTVGNNWNATIAADLPRVQFKLVNDLPSDTSKLKLRFKVDSGAERVIALSGFYSGGTINFPVPVEDALNVPKTHTLTILSIFQDDDNSNTASQADSYRALGPSNGAFPAIGGLYRTKAVTDAGTFDSLLLIPKYRSN